MAVCRDGILVTYSPCLRLNASQQVNRTVEGHGRENSKPLLSTNHLRTSSQVS